MLLVSYSCCPSYLSIIRYSSDLMMILLFFVQLKSVAHLPWRAFMYKVCEPDPLSVFSPFSFPRHSIHSLMMCLLSSLQCQPHTGLLFSEMI